MTIRRTNIRTKVTQDAQEAQAQAQAEQGSQTEQEKGEGQPAEKKEEAEVQAEAIIYPEPAKQEEKIEEPPATSEEAEAPFEIQRIPTKVSLPPGPAARRVTTRKVSYNEQYDKRTLSIDKRITPYWDDLMGEGINKTMTGNQWVLKILLDAGYQIDPNILDQPFVRPKKRPKGPLK